MASQRLTIVIKLGTSSIVDENTHEPILSILTLIVETAAKLHRDGHNVVLVSSGAVGVGLRRMDVEERPKYLPRIQALAAVGQCRLMSLWDGLFSHLRLPVAQILLTRNDIADRTQYINAQNTFAQLFDMGVIPIVNENDTLAVSEIKFGDNDTLSAITAAMVKANYLFLMTDVDCLYTANPRNNPDAQPIEVVTDISSLEADVSSAGSSLGTGGMSTKIVAAKLGTSAGVTTIITKSSKPGNVHEIVKYLQQAQQETLADPTTENNDHSSILHTPPPLHTRFIPSETPIQSRSFWLLHGLKPRGTIYIDHGAYSALQKKAGLLPAGVVGVEGHFGQQEAVRLVVVEKISPDSLNGEFLHHGQEPREVGRALVNYSSSEIIRIKGHRSTQIQSLLGYADSEYVALRENISFIRNDESPRH
ncbi:glutamate 5-kinase [Aspergillus ibericus CBS 121593]|uniref:Putative glutamate 5-kinase n=1 Tax=Aspergillus ibericus CBS 121593 TaxID=1448316 RepID=A0A395HFJ9_9EURO|nr:putative glutamate 5-kinase [Aspergillus ibericus CBS 121593]RAL06233.1 putative glutamate 5-kinase [Aspergillus ibericus CBS 121593]